MKENNKKIYSLKKVILINLLIFMLMGGILYKLLPYVLNYPPNSIDNQFQVDLVGIKYTHQYIVLFSALMLILFITLKVVLSKLSLKHDNYTVDDINKIRKKCFNYPYFMLIFQAFIPTIFAAILLVIFNTEFELLLRLTTLIFSFTTLFAIISYMVNKRFFVNKLILTSKSCNDRDNSMKLNMPLKLFLQLIPLFLYSFVLILLMTTSIMTTEKGDLLYHFYREELVKTFDTSKVYDISEIKDSLKNIGFENKLDHSFIFSANTGTVYHSDTDLNNFFISYAQNYYDSTNGHIYDNYGQNIGGAAIRLQTESEDVFVGVRYFVFGSGFIAPFIIMALLLITFNTLFVLYIGKDLSHDISSVTSALNRISHSEDITNSKDLPITSNDEIGELTIAFNNIQDLNKNYIHQLHNNQDQLVEQERLASLGQMIGGIAHNLKTPIMSISGAAEGINDLINEFDASIGNPVVTEQDFHDIAKDMIEWTTKIKSYTEYMSDVITAVKGQATNLSNETEISFTITELFKRVNILMKHELKKSVVYLNTSTNIDENTIINGNINSLVQVINNMISNAIQSYNGVPEKEIDLIASKQDNNIVISIKDYGPGLPKVVRDKLFKEMVTTKGKNGTGLGLYMSYSNIKAHFNGTITFDTKTGQGTTFNIIIPM